MVHQLIAKSVKDSPIRPGRSKPPSIHSRPSRAVTADVRPLRAANTHEAPTGEDPTRLTPRPASSASAPNWHRAPQSCSQTGRCPHRPARTLPCPARPHRSVVGKHGTDVAQRETCPSTRRDAGLCSPVRAAGPGRAGPQYPEVLHSAAPAGMGDVITGRLCFLL